MGTIKTRWLVSERRHLTPRYSSSSLKRQPHALAACCVQPTSHRERGISVTAQTGQLTSLYEWMWAC
ncbi:hypothetical protein GOODEAATRI_009278 [Goodea atripinnis]|uniref:Uncharacterized protein n=1 Tax=Goodea atripinnis TaxID=208336 RepID=A0ABV0MRX4_9TELE